MSRSNKGRRINLVALLVMLVTPIVVGVGVYFLHNVQVQRSAEVMIKLADEAKAKGDLTEERRNLVRYLEFRPFNFKAVERLADVLDAIADGQPGRDRAEALRRYEQLVRRFPDREDLRRKVINITLAGGDLQTARTHLAQLSQKEPKNAEDLEQLGEVEESLGDMKKARDAYEAARKADPSFAKAYIRLAMVTRDEKNGKNVTLADKIMDELVANNPSSVDAYLGRRAYRVAFKLPKADEDLAAAVKLAPNNADVILAQVESALLNNNYESAKNRLERGKELYPKDARFLRTLAAVEQRTGKVGDAVKHLEENVKVAPKGAEDDALLTLIESQIDARQLDAAEANIEKLKAKKLLPAAIQILEGRIQVARKDWSKGITTLTSALAKLSQLPEAARRALAVRANLALGEAYEGIGNAENQLAAYRRVLADGPGLVAGIHGQGRALVALNRHDDALVEFQRISGAYPEAGLDVARILVARNMQRPKEQRDWPQVHKVLDQVQAALPRSVGPLMLRAEVLASQGIFNEARRALEEVCKRDPKEAAAWVDLAILEERQGHPERVLPALDDAEKKLGDRVEIRLGRALFLARQNAPDAASKIAKLTEGIGKFAERDQVMLSAAVGAILERIEKAAPAAYWQSIAEQLPADLNSRLHLYNIAQRAKDFERADALISEIRRIEGEEGALWRYAEAAKNLVKTREGDKSALAKTIAMLPEIESRRPGWARLNLLEAEVAQHQGNHDRAIDLYRRALNQGEDQASIIRQLVSLQFRRGKFSEAQEDLRRLPASSPLSGEIGRIASALSLRDQGPARALELAKKSINPGSKDYVDHLFLGQVLDVAGDSAGAEQSFRKAVVLAPDQPIVWLSLTRSLIRSGRSADAANVAAQAAEKLPKDSSSLAQIYETIGDMKQAEAIHIASLRANSTQAGAFEEFGEFLIRQGRASEAVPILEKIGSAEVVGTAAERQRGNRFLALALIADSDYARFRRALGLLDQNLKENGNAVEDQRAKAVILATRQSHRREAVRLFEDLSRRQSPPPDEQFLLARFHEAGGDWNRAAQQMALLLRSDPKNPNYIAYYVSGLLRQKDARTAEPWLADLRKLEPNALRTVELDARLAAVRGDSRKAVSLLTEYAKGKDVRTLGHVAGVLDEIKLTEAADTAFREYVAKSGQPLASLQYAVFLGKNNRVKDALDLCEKAKGKATVEQIAAASLTIIRSQKAEPEDYRRVEIWLDEMTKGNPTVRILAEHRAFLLGYLGRYDDVEKIYRDFLRKNPKDGAALNNLAWLLALRDGRSAAPDALSLVNQAIEVVGPTSDLLDTRAVVRLAQGDIKGALDDLNDALYQAQTPSIYFHMAQAHEKAKNKNAALQAFKRAESLGLSLESLDPLERDVYFEMRKSFGASPDRTQAAR